jgi:hypothetical protein
MKSENIMIFSGIESASEDLRKTTMKITIRLVVSRRQKRHTEFRSAVLPSAAPVLVSKRARREARSSIEV